VFRQIQFGAISGYLAHATQQFSIGCSRNICADGMRDHRSESASDGIENGD
jgi:hypothetical protein